MDWAVARRFGGADACPLDSMGANPSARLSVSASSPFLLGSEMLRGFGAAAAAPGRLVGDALPVVRFFVCLSAKSVSQLRGL